MKLFFKYIYQCRHTAAFLVISASLFACVFYLYDVNPEAVAYAALLCTAVGAVTLCVGFRRFYKRQRLLESVLCNLPLMTDCLPDPQDLTQENLQKIIVRLSKINRESLSKLNLSRQQSLEYFTVWAHQIKTPISAMQILLQSDDTPQNRELSAELFLIEQYASMALGFLRLDSVTTDYVIKEYCIDSIVKKALHRYAPLIIRRRLKLVYDPVDAAVLTDEKWLTFIIEQLLSNAVKYTASGTVTVAYENGLLSVSDTGIGISPEDMPRIFEMGYTGLSGRTSSKSTGIGLYLCKRIADNLGHKLTVTSEVGKGTKVTLDLRSADLKFD